MKPARPMIVGLTGSFGSGKSSVAQLFAELGVQVVDADRLAHETLEPGSPVFGALQKEFAEALAADGSGFNRKKLAALIFKDASRRTRLEAMVHPYVFQRIDEEIEKAGGPLVILEVPLLFETGYDMRCDKTIFVEASPEVIARRLGKKGFAQNDIDQRNAAQMPAAEKKAKADFTICNDATIEKIREEVQRIFAALCPDRKGA